MKTRVLSDRQGMTLLEVIVGLVIMGFLVSAVFGFLRQQEIAFGLGTRKMNALQNYRFAADLLERNIRTAGTGIAASQPFIVYADSATLAFNADYSTNDEEDAFAVYHDAAASNTEVGSLTRARRFTLPQTTFTYPDSTYRNGGATSSAETIIFYFTLDGSTARSDDYVLFRAVNDLPAQVVARDLLRDAGRPFFRYQEVVSTDTAAATANWIAPATLPLRHGAALHMAPGDTGTVARIDRLRAVQVSFRSTDGLPGQLAQEAAVRKLIRMPNAGQMQLRTCGESPVFTASIAAAQVSGSPEIEVSWSQSFDEASGEQDVVRYAIYRRTGGTVDWGEPHFSIPAGNASYIYSDAAVVPAESYQYAVAAQDCTPSMSGFRLSTQVTVSP